MGYYTYFSLNKLEGSDEDFDALVKDIKDKVDLDFSSGDPVKGKWYKHEEDMLKYSKKYPGLLVELYGDGENSDDQWSERFRNGECESHSYIRNDITFLHLLTEKEKAPKAPDFWQNAIYQAVKGCFADIFALMRNNHLKEVDFQRHEADGTLSDRPTATFDEPDGENENIAYEHVNKIRFSDSGDEILISGTTMSAYIDKDGGDYFDVAHSIGRIYAALAEVISNGTFYDDELALTDFYLLPEEQRKGVTDSLLLESGIEVLSAELAGYRFSVCTSGHVRIVWKDESYKNRSDFPEDLAEAIRNHTLDSRKDAFVDENNWYELSIYRCSDNKCLFNEVVDIDLSELNEKDAEEFIRSFLEIARTFNAS